MKSSSKNDCPLHGSCNFCHREFSLIHHPGIIHHIYVVSLQCITIILVTNSVHILQVCMAMFSCVSSGWQLLSVCGLQLPLVSPLRYSIGLHRVALPQILPPLEPLPIMVKKGCTLPRCKASTMKGNLKTANHVSLGSSYMLYKSFIVYH